MGKALAQQVGIVLAQDGERLEHGGLGLVDADLARHACDKRGVDVVHVQLVDTEHLLSQRDIAVHFIEIAVYGLDEVRIDLGRHLGMVEGRRERVGVLARAGEEQPLTELGVERRGDRILKLAHAGVIALKSIAAQRAVGALLQRDEGPVGERMLPALAVRDRIEADVGVAEGAADLIRGARDFPGGGEKPLFLRGEDMSRAAADLVDAAAVGLQLRLDNIEQVEPVLVDRHDLRRGKGSRARDGDVGVHGLAAHILIKAVRRVLIGRAAGVGVQRRQTQLELILEPEKAEELLRALAETAAVGRDARGHVLERLILRRPGRVVGKHVP